jgi:hypothetical protein
MARTAQDLTLGQFPYTGLPVQRPHAMRDLLARINVIELQVFCAAALRARTVFLQPKLTTPGGISRLVRSLHVWVFVSHARFLVCQVSQL